MEKRKIDWGKLFVCCTMGKVVLCNLISFLYFKQKQDNFLISPEKLVEDSLLYLCKHIRLKLFSTIRAYGDKAR